MGLLGKLPFVVERLREKEIKRETRRERGRESTRAGLGERCDRLTDSESDATTRRTRSDSRICFCEIV